MQKIKKRQPINKSVLDSLKLLVLNIQNLSPQLQNKDKGYPVKKIMTQIKYKTSINKPPEFFVHGNQKDQLIKTLELKWPQKRYKKIINLVLKRTLLDITIMLPKYHHNFLFY